MFYALAAHPDYWKNKLNMFVALAPVSSLHNSTAYFLKTAAKFYTEIKAAANLVGIYSLLTPGIPSKLVTAFCTTVPSICNDLQVFATSYDLTHDDLDRFAVYMGHYPSGISLQSLYHYSQDLNNANSDMPWYDWGSAKLN